MEEGVGFGGGGGRMVGYVREEREVGGKVLKKGESVIVFVGCGKGDEGEFGKGDE